MAYFSGVSFGNDEIGSTAYLDNVTLFEEDNDNEDDLQTRNFSGYDYHPAGDMYKPPLPKPLPRKMYTRPLRGKYDTWRLKTDTKQREGYERFTIDDDKFWIVASLIIFIMIIYCIVMVRVVRSISTEIIALLKIIHESKKE